MKRAFLIPLAAAVICSISPLFVNAASVSVPEVSDTVVSAGQAEAYAERVAAMVNQVRRENGVPEMMILPTLNRIANVRANEITQKFDHTRPDGSGIRDIIDQYNVGWRKIGENIAKGQPTPESAMDSWMHSERHRGNILNPDYQYIGVSVVYANGTYHWVQIFLKPSSTVNSGAYLPRNFGDVNDDGVIDGIDASTVLTDYALRSVGSQAILDEPHLDIADITRDGIVNAIDATSILTLYANNSVN